MIVTSLVTQSSSRSTQTNTIPQSAVLISSDHNDDQRYWEYTDDKHKNQIDDFKKP